jgi:prolyl oligopeptidase
MFEQLKSPGEATQTFVSKQNARTEAAFMDAAFDKDVAEAARIMASEDTLSALSRRGAWIYNFRKTKDNPRGVWRRRPHSIAVDPHQGWEIVFDVDAYCAETGEDWHWRGAPTSPDDPERVLIALSQGGSDQSVYREYDCTARAFIEDGFAFGPERGNVSWLDADTVLWSSALDGDATDASWPGTVRKVPRGSDPKDGEVIFRAEKSDVTCFAYSIELPSGQRIPCASRIPNIGEEECTVFFPEGPLRLQSPSDTSVSHNAGHFAYVVKTEGGPKGALMLGRIGGAATRVVMEVVARQAINGFFFLKDWLLWTLSDNLKPRLYALDLRDDGAQPIEIAPPEAADSVFLGYHNANPERDETLQMNLQGFLQSPRIYTFDLENGPEAIQFTELWRDPEEFDATGMTVQLLDATSDDGTEVPYHLVLPKDAADDVPILLYGYGGFEVSIPPFYDAVKGALWMGKRNGYALAHIRGGGEFGPDWHAQAKRENRHKAFEDFASIASDLVRRGITKPQRIACNGGSNGGLLTGVMLTRYPERFGAVWTTVGVHDMLGFHEFPAGRAWMDEYGDPNNPVDAEWLRAYSPLHNVVPVDDRAYPACLVETSDFDDRVDPSHSRRFAARLLEADQNAYFVEHKGGHGGSSSLFDRAKTACIGFSFLRHALGTADGS